VNARATALSAAAVATIPLWDLELFGKVGIAKVKAESHEASLAGTTFKLGKNDNEAHVGLGLAYRLTREWDVRAEFERIQGLQDRTSSRSGSIPLLSFHRAPL